MSNKTRHSRIRLLIRFTLCIVAVLLSAPSAATFTPLGVPDGHDATESTDISPDGTAVTGMSTQSSNEFAFVWVESEGFSPSLSGSSPSSSVSVSNLLPAITAAGVVPASPARYSVLGMRNGDEPVSFTVSEPLTSSGVFDIYDDTNQFNDITFIERVRDGIQDVAIGGRGASQVGSLYRARPQDPIEPTTRRVFRREAYWYRAAFGPFGATQLNRLGTLAGDLESEATAIALTGVVVVAGNSGKWAGSEDGIEPSQPFIWREGDTDLTEIPTKGKALGISADGTTVVGSHRIDAPQGGSVLEAFRWTSSTGVEGLGCVSESGVAQNCGTGQFSGSFSEAYDASSDGSVIVGKSAVLVFGGGSSEAFWWFNGTMYNLETVLETQGDDLTGFTLIEATAVSDDGLIITGNAVNNGEGRREAFIAMLDPAALSDIFAGP